MSDVFILVIKALVIMMLALFLGRKTGLFSLGRGASVFVLILVTLLFGTSVYASLFRPDITLKIMFSSSFASFTLDLSFFLRLFLLTLFLGLVCSCFGIRPYVKISSVRDLCTLALLIALTVLLGIYATFRVGSAIKIAFKFIPVFITSALFGPFWGGMVGALSDVIAFVVNPVGGAFLPQITIIEFFYGFIYGLFFYKMTSWGGYKTMLKIVICVVLQIVVLNLGLTTYMLMPIMQLDFNSLLVIRAPAAVINMALQLIILSVMSKYITTFRKVLK